MKRIKFPLKWLRKKGDHQGKYRGASGGETRFIYKNFYYNGQKKNVTNLRVPRCIV